MSLRQDYSLSPAAPERFRAEALARNEAPDGFGTRFSSWARIHGRDIPASTAMWATLSWSRLHGFVSLEIAHIFESMGVGSARHEKTPRFPCKHWELRGSSWWLRPASIR